LNNKKPKNKNKEKEKVMFMFDLLKNKKLDRTNNFNCTESVFDLKLFLGLDKIRAKKLEKNIFSLAKPQENILSSPNYLKY
jgi:hypothetical protein